MIQFALYGKGGIGKSTVASNIAAALSERGLTVMQIGCDPKADSTSALLHGEKRGTVIDVMQKRGHDFALEDIVSRGYAGVICVEAGGPTPGLGCAGRAITAALEALHEKNAYDVLAPDAIIYDVLGDVVCGGFSVPMRAGYATKVFIVTSGENMALHAGANIALAVKNFASRGYATLGGIILNRRDVKNEEEKVAELAADVESEVIGAVDRSATVTDAEELNMCVMEAFPKSRTAEQYKSIAASILASFEKEEGAGKC